MRKRPRFKIGDWVTVNSTVFFYYENNERKFESQTTSPWIGQIAGAQIKQLGKYVKGATIFPSWCDEWGEHDPSYLKVSKTMTVWLVKRGMLNKPSMALEEELKLVPGDLAPKKLPWIHANQPACDERYRNECRLAAKMMTRDKRGRFKKNTTILK